MFCEGYVIDNKVLHIEWIANAFHENKWIYNATKVDVVDMPGIKSCRCMQEKCWHIFAKNCKSDVYLYSMPETASGNSCSKINQKIVFWLRQMDKWNDDLIY